jgi:prevent-host-death family protein
MTKVGVARLKAELSRYLAVAKDGEEVVITERGRPVARLVALQGTEKTESRRERLARAGVLTLGKGRVRPALRKPPKGPAWVGAAVLAALLEERAEGRA